MDGEKENILKRDRKRLSSTYFNQASGKTKCIQKLKCIQKPRYIETESFVIHTRFFEAGFLLFFFGSSLFFRLSSVFPAPVCSSGSRLLFRLPSVLPAPLRFSGSPRFFRLPSLFPAPVRFSGSRPLLPDTECPKPILPLLFLSAHLFYGYAPDLFIFHAPDLIFFRHTNNEIGIFGSLTVAFPNISRGFTVSYPHLSGLFRRAFRWL